MLFVFVEREKITSLALSLEKPIEKILSLFDNVINHFESDDNSFVQYEVASAMLDKSFILWKYSKANNDNNLFQQSFSVNEEIIGKNGKNDPLKTAERVP